MRVRVLQAFSGNNSGSYVLVGTFREERDASALGEELRRVLDAHGAWLATQGSLRSDASPLHAYATEQGIATEPRIGQGDDWPTYGTAPDVVVAGPQLLVFVDYSVTFPRFVGQLVYQRGGRIAVELDHSHEPIVLVHEIWKHEGWNEKEAARAAVDAFRIDVEDGALESLYADPARHEQRPPPVVAAGFWPGNVQLVHSPWDVADGVRVVDALVRKHGLASRFSLFETPVHGADPIRAWRGLSLGEGDHQVILWKPGPVVADTVRAVRATTGLTLAEATELVARAPVEVLLRVSERDAHAARDAILASGGDAEALGPQHFRRK